MTRTIPSSENRAQSVIARYIPQMLAFLIVLTGFWMSLGKLQHYQNADSIVPALVSLQHWTPFFWETNRYGMLVPLVAIPFRNPLTNLVLQTALGVSAGLACSFLLVTYLFDDSVYWLIAAALQNIWLLLLVPAPIQFDWFVTQCYGVSFALGFAALVLVRKERVLWAVVLMLLCHWVNSAAFLVLIPLVLQRHLIDRTRKNLWISLVVIVAGAVGGIIFMLTAHYQTTLTGLAPIDTWIPGWLQVIHLAWQAAFAKPLLALWMAVPAACGLAGNLLFRTGKRAILISLSLVITAILYGLLIGTFAWTRANVYMPRYVYPSLLLLGTAIALVTIAPWKHFLRARSTRLCVFTSGTLVFVAAITAFGMPSITGVEDHLRQRFGSMTAEILASRAPVITGDYWTVWPAVFEANLVLYRQGETRRVYGDTYRGVGTWELWSHQKLCMDASISDPDPTHYMNDMVRSFHLAQTYNTVEMFCEDNDK